MQSDDKSLASRLWYTVAGRQVLRLSELIAGGQTIVVPGSLGLGGPGSLEKLPAVLHRWVI